MKDINGFVESMESGSEKFVLTNEGDINKFLGIEITQLDDKRFMISHPFLIDIIRSYLNIDMNNYGMETNAKSTPVGKPLLIKELSGKPRNEIWKYRTSVGMLNYLQGNSCPKLPMAVHQTAQFSNSPMLFHEKYIKCLGQYLYHTKKEGYHLQP